MVRSAAMPLLGRVRGLGDGGTGADPTLACGFVAVQSRPRLGRLNTEMIENDVPLSGLSLL